MEGKRFIRTLRLQNILSYGSEGQEVELLPLNVLIGPNASGKSNLIEAIDLLRATPKDLTVPIREGGGIDEWLWKGAKDAPTALLSQRKDPDQYPEITYLSNQFSEFQLYREWNLGRYTAPRMPQKPDLPENFLLEDASNLGLVLNDLQHRPGTKQLIVDKLKKFYDAVDDITTKIHGGTVQLFIHEKGLNQPVPATRLSDGTLRYLCLLSLLCHPTPPPLICIEEPELGLHPDILPTIAELLIEASKRTQLIVTTHSDGLVSALTEMPDSILVCEHDERGSHLRRLDPDHLKQWLERYSLGELWRMGEIGGTRW